MQAPKFFWLKVCRDLQRRVWASARVQMKDGSCLVIEGRVFKESGVQGRDYAAGDEEPPQNKALDDALDKLCKLAKTPLVKAALPLPARLALSAVCKARNLSKIKKAIDQGDEGADEYDADEVSGELRIMVEHGDVERRAVGAVRRLYR